MHVKEPEPGEPVRSGTIYVVPAARHMSDGARGLQAIRRAGGTTIVQRPTTARFPQMSRAARAADGIDFTQAPEKIAQTVIDLVTAPA